MGFDWWLIRSSRRDGIKPDKHEPMEIFTHSLVRCEKQLFFLTSEGKINSKTGWDSFSCHMLMLYFNFLHFYRAAFMWCCLLLCRFYTFYSLQSSDVVCLFSLTSPLSCFFFLFLFQLSVLLLFLNAKTSLQNLT